MEATENSAGGVEVNQAANVAQEVELTEEQKANLANQENGSGEAKTEDTVDENTSGAEAAGQEDAQA